MNMDEKKLSYEEYGKIMGWRMIRPEEIVIETDDENNLGKFMSCLIALYNDEYNFVYLTGYLDFYGHFRITDSHSMEVKELAPAIMYLALNEDRLVSEFKDYPEHKN